MHSSEGEERYQREVRRHLRRNYLAHLVHGLLGQTGFRIVNAPTFVPAYMDLLSGGNPIWVGAARASQSLGMFLSPILGATSIEHRRRVLPVGFLVGGAMRIQILGIALAGFLLPLRWNLYAVCLFLGLFGFFLGMQGVVFSYLVSKVIPVERRGTLLGLRNTLSAVTAAFVGGVGGVLVARETLGNGYAATFGISFVLTSFGLASLVFVREPEPPSVREPARVSDRLRQLPALLRADRGFTWYFLARALGMMGRMAMPFYVLSARARADLGDAQLGLLTAAFVVGQGTPLLWGLLADRAGFRAVWVTSLLLWMGTTLIMLSAASSALLVGAFVGLGAGLAGFMLASQNLVLEFGSREDLPMRIAVANSSTELVGAVGPLLGGLLAATFSYDVVFWSAFAVQAAAVVIVLVAVPEPRSR